MRRPRSKLQVSTFPFLAVLLCAMGSLLLLLFIMDRRAKIAAQHHAAEAIAKKEKRSTKEEDARKAEWEQAKERLRQSLLTEHEKLAERAEAERRKMQQSGQTLEVIRAQHLEAKAKIAAESAKIGELRLAIESQRAGVSITAKKETASKAELLDAAKELADLEVTLRQLRALKDEEKAVYSLIPYRGRQGEFRKPIYVECVAPGVIFQPDGYERLGPWFTLESVRAAIEARAGKLVPEKTEKEKGRAEPKEKTDPYVLFLVRPDGIASYYKAQAVLRGYQIDFGYELIDDDWTFDFAKKGPQPPPRLVTLPRNPAMPRTPGVIQPPPGISISGSSPLGSGGGLPGIGGPSSPLGSVGKPVIGGVPDSGSIGGVPGSTSPTLGDGTSKPGAGGKLPEPSSGPFTANQPNPGGAAYPKVDTGIPVQRPSFVPIAKSPFANGPASGQPRASNNPSTAMGSSPISNGPASGQPLASSKPEAPLLPLNPLAPGQSGGSPPPSGSVPENKGTPVDRPPPVFAEPGAKPKPPAPLPSPLGRILGNKDFVLTLDCYADHITVFPGGTQFRWKNAQDGATDQALVKHIANLIARRQASVRSDEPPYRPVIRFQVSTEGVQTFLRAYPILEPLRVEMTRENVQD